VKHNAIFLPSEPAHLEELMATLQGPARLPHDPPELIYPGSGCDFKSFWAVTDPVRAVLIDPAPVTNFETPIVGIEKWKSQLIDQIGPVLSPITQARYNLRTRTLEEISDDILTRLTRAQCNDEGEFRLAFSARVRIRDKVRVVTFCAGWFQEVSTLSGMDIPSHLQAFFSLRSTWPIVYEHKSMVSVSEMAKAILPGGCLIWGLPDEAPEVQWLSIDSIPEIHAIE
jgi:hypothetical protein